MAATNTLPIPKDRSLYLSKQVDQASINELTKSIIAVSYTHLTLPTKA